MATAISAQPGNTNFNRHSPSRDITRQEESPSQAEASVLSNTRTFILRQRLFEHSKRSPGHRFQLEATPVSLSKKENSFIAEKLLKIHHENSPKFSAQLKYIITKIYFPYENPDEYTTNHLPLDVEKLFALLNSDHFSGTPAELAQIIIDLQQILLPKTSAPSPVEIPDPFPIGYLRIQSETSKTENTKTLIPPAGDTINDQLLRFFYGKNDEILPELRDSIKNYSYPFLGRISNFHTESKNGDASLEQKRPELIADLKNFLIHDLINFYHKNSSRFSRASVTSLRNYIYAPVNDVHAHYTITLLIKHLKKHFLNNPLIEAQSQNLVKKLIEGLQIILSTISVNPNAARPPSTPSSILQDLSDFLEENKEKIPSKLQNGLVAFTHAQNGTNSGFNKTLNGTLPGKNKDEHVYYFGKLFIHHLENFLLKNPELKMEGGELIDNLQKLVLSPIRPSDDTKEALETEIELEVAIAAEAETVRAALRNPPEIPIGVKPPIASSPAEVNALRFFDQRKPEFDAIVAEYDNKIEKVKIDIAEAKIRYGRISSKPSSQYGDAATTDNKVKAQQEIDELQNKIVELEKEFDDRMLAAASLPQHLRANIRLEYSDPSGTQPYNHHDDTNGIQSALFEFVEAIKNQDSLPEKIKKELESIEKALRIGQTETKKINYLPSIRKKLFRCVNDLCTFFLNKNSGVEIRTLRHLQSAQDALLDREKYSQETPEERQKRLIPPPSHLKGLKLALAFFPGYHDKISAIIYVSRNPNSRYLGYFCYSEKGPVINIDPSIGQIEETRTFCHELGHYLASLDPSFEKLAWEYLEKYCMKDSNGLPIIINGCVQGLPNERIFGTYRSRVSQDSEGNYWAREVSSQGLEDMCTRAGTLYKKDPDRFKLIYDLSRTLAQNNKYRGEPLKNAQV